MEEKNEYKHHQMKGITFLIIGVFVGILLCVSFILIEQRYLGNKFHTKQILTLTEKSISQPTEISMPQQIKKQVVIVKDTIFVSDSLLTEIDTMQSFLADAIDYDYDDLYIDNSEDTDDDIIFKEQIIAQRKIKVNFPHNGEDESVVTPNNAFSYFDVEQWQTLIKNKVSYCREGNVLKIKGLDISNIAIHYLNENYYLEHNNHLYAIIEQTAYQRLSLIDSIQL